MRLVKIKNKYLFNSDNPNGVHTYAVYYDNRTKQNRAIALTHLYIKYDKRFKQVKKGNIMVSKFKEFETPTWVQNYYYSKNTSGKNISLKDRDIVKVNRRYLPNKQANEIKRFAKYNKNESKKKSVA